MTFFLELEEDKSSRIDNEFSKEQHSFDNIDNEVRQSISKQRISLNTRVDKLQRLFSEMVNPKDRSDFKYPVYNYGWALYLLKKIKEANLFCEAVSNLINDQRASYLVSYNYAPTATNLTEALLNIPTDIVKIVTRLIEMDLSNFKTALRFLVKETAFQIGLILYEFHIGQRYISETIKLWQYAADETFEAYSINAQSFLGFYYARPDSLDLNNVALYHKRAALNCNPDSTAVLGVLYLEGMGVEKNDCIAMDLLTLAASWGSLLAKAYCVKAYFHKKMYTLTCHLSVKLFKDIVKIPAVEQKKNYDEASLRGLSLAAFLYGICLTKGLGVHDDRKLARKYFKMSLTYDANMYLALQDKYFDQI